MADQGKEDVSESSSSNKKTLNLAVQLGQLKMPSTTAAKDLSEASRHSYKFWATQPVPKFDEVVTDNTFIEADMDVSKLRKEPYSLPSQFEWRDIDIDDEEELNELYTLLSENYVEDDDNMFRFDYSPEFLRWALRPPGYHKQWHVGVRAVVQKKSEEKDNSKKGKLLAFISAIPVEIRVYDKTVKMVEINFLCVHKKLRSKRVAPVLIREITRRVNLAGIFQAAFTAGIVIPKPIAQCRYWHRSLNPKKLIDVGFSHLARKMTLQRTIKLYKLPDAPKTPGLIQMEERHLDAAFNLLTEHLKLYDLVPIYTREEFAHFFLPRAKVVYTYVVEKDGKVTDFLSFYSLPSSIMNHSEYKTLCAAYSFYNVATSVKLVELVNDGLILAKKEGFDVFNALDLMENKDFLEELKFGIGDGNLQYYLYNWKCPDMEPQRVGLVLQ
ncbi:hypothetical protein QR680_015217 [Steinernema hermaphroditum]|uniref:Glycylpeptide N-tetradecanoyltransferase n=1 Tax=Steinernema hermaphroditum TaxID=289476 RepID=A0AA39IE62_9BILA|nr:hypothetical protein QR680_015217 [Steinernema hermaphroditum]